MCVQCTRVTVEGYFSLESPDVKSQCENIWMVGDQGKVPSSMARSQLVSYLDLDYLCLII